MAQPRQYVCARKHGPVGSASSVSGTRTGSGALTSMRVRWKDRRGDGADGGESAREGVRGGSKGRGTER